MTEHSQLCPQLPPVPNQFKATFDYSPNFNHFPKECSIEDDSDVSLLYFKKKAAYNKPIRERAIHFPGQHYFKQCKHEDMESHRDKSYKTYEHPIRFERRILTDTMRQLSTAVPLLYNKGHRSAFSQIQFRPLRLHRKEIPDNTNVIGEYEHKNTLFVISNAPHTSRYTIDPHYVSEFPKKKRATRSTNQSSKDGFIYGTQSPIRLVTKRDAWIAESVGSSKTIKVPPLKYAAQQKQCYSNYTY